MSPESNRSRARSSKKRRATLAPGGGPGLGPAGAPVAGGPTTGGPADRGRVPGRPARPATERVRGGPPRGRGPTSTGISTVAIAAILVVVAAVGLAFATGAIKLGGDQPGGAVGIPAACPKSQPPAAPPGQTQLVTIGTEKGPIEITLSDDLSPIAVGNFVALAKCGYYDGVVFHRVVDNFVIQGGDGQYGRAASLNRTRVGQGGPGYVIQDEPVTATYGRGVVAMARTSAPNSVGSQFFIVLADSAQKSLAQVNTYQIIGTVTKGIDVADAIAAAAGGVENPAHPIAMTTVTVAGPGGSAAPAGSAATSSQTPGGSPAP